MKTLVLHEPGRLELIQTDPPAHLPDGHALVRVHRVGICGTDLHAYRGKQPFFSYPRILGHELGVEILEIGDNDLGLKAGDRCAVEPYLNCGTCIACRRGKPNCCTTLKVLGVHADGGMREQIVVPIRKLHPSTLLSYEQLALVETLGIGAHAVHRSQVEVGETALVIGAGPIGLSVVQFAEQAGAKVHVLDVNADRLAFCANQFAVAGTHLLSDDAPARVGEANGGELPTVVFDATGNPASMHNAFQFLANGAKLVFVGLFIGDVTFHDPDFHRRELALLATRNSTPEDFRRIIGWMEAGEISTDPWITHRALAEEVVGQFPSWLLPETGVLKAVVEF